MAAKKHLVTGAFGFSGKYIAKLLLEHGEEVETLTNSPSRRSDLTTQIKAHRFNFNDHNQLVRSLENVQVLYNTYWVRFNHKNFTYREGVYNSLNLFKAAQQAGVEKIIHTSITNPSLDSPLEYFKGKAEVEKALIATGIPYAILRPAVLFGKEDILINNIAWALRRFPLFPVFGYGSYRLQPIFVGDFAKLAVTLSKRDENVIVNAIGPETFTYKSLVETIGDSIGATKPIVSVPPRLGYIISMLTGRLLGDILLTKDEITGLMEDLLYVDDSPAGETKLSQWTRKHRETVGRKYASELERRINRKRGY